MAAKAKSTKETKETKAKAVKETKTVKAASVKETKAVKPAKKAEPKAKKKIAILTSGGDAPGMNAAIVSVARFAEKEGFEPVGILGGYHGVLHMAKSVEESTVTLTPETLLDIEDARGTYLKSARCKRFYEPKYRAQAAKLLKKEGFEALVVIGGDGSYQGAAYLAELGIPCVGIPGTIDNDLSYTERTLGFNTAVTTCVEAVRSIRSTARSHGRAHIIEVMGRRCGDIAMETAMATGAEIVVIPEITCDIEAIEKRLKKLYKAGNHRISLVVCEHFWENMKPYPWKESLKAHNIKVRDDDEFSSEYLCQLLEAETGIEVRYTVLGYIQRGGIPTVDDNVFAFGCGREAVRLIKEDLKKAAADPDAKRGSWAVGQKDGRVFSMPIADALAIPRSYDKETYELINSL